MPKVALRQIDKFAIVIKNNLEAAKGGMTYDKLGEIMGISKGTAWARDKCPLDIKLGELFLLCQRKGIDISEFVGGELKLKGADRS